jgi:hypothetical protein
MKQGTFATKVIMMILLIGVVAYVGVYIIRSVSTPYQTELAYAFQVEEVSTASGYLARTETALPSASGLVEVSPREGERVSKNQTIATIYTNEAAFNQQQTIKSLEEQLAQLKEIASSAEESLDKARLDREIASGIIQLRQLAASQSFSQLDTISSAFKSLVFKRDYTADQADQLSTLISDLSSQITALQANASQQAQTISASVAGTYSSLVDGYESILTKEQALALTPSAFHALAPASADQTAVGKLITDSTWYFVTALPQEQAQGLKVNHSVTVRFARSLPDAVHMTVTSISEPENGEVVVVFSCNRYLDQITLMRQTSADIIASSYSGLRIPKESLRVLEDGTVGVYCMAGLQAEFRQVEIIYEGDSFYLVSISTESKGLKAGDQVFVVGEALYSGKVFS